jgi:hypothetical protein
VSKRVVPKSSRRCCVGEENASAIPGPFATGQRLRNGFTLLAAAAREAANASLASAN